MFDFFGFPWNWVARLVAVAAIVGACWFAWDHYVANPYIAEGVSQQALVTAKVQKEFDEYKAAAVAKTAQAHDEIVATLADVAALQSKLTEERNAAKTKFAALAKSLPAGVASQPVSAVAVGVLNDAVAASNAQGNGTDAGATAKSGEAPAAASGDSTVGAVTIWGTQVVDQYGECVQQVEGLQDLWNRTRTSLNKDGP